MNILIDVAPSVLEIGGVQYEIHSDFRTWILFEQLMQDNAVPDLYKPAQAKSLVFCGGSPPAPLDEQTVEQMLWFYRQGKTEEVRAVSGRGTSAGIYDYDFDAGYIYAAFLQQYGVDLQTVEHLHWWQFQAMFASLRECRFTEIMGYRSMDVSADLSPQQKKFYREMKRIYRLPAPETEREKVNEIERRLLNGENISDFL